jgi:hypothetical protein
VEVVWDRDSEGPGASLRAAVRLAWAGNGVVAEETGELALGSHTRLDLATAQQLLDLADAADGVAPRAWTCRSPYARASGGGGG